MSNFCAFQVFASPKPCFNNISARFRNARCKRLPLRRIKVEAEEIENFLVLVLINTDIFFRSMAHSKSIFLSQCLISIAAIGIKLFTIANNSKVFVFRSCLVDGELFYNGLFAYRYLCIVGSRIFQLSFSTGALRIIVVRYTRICVFCTRDFRFLHCTVVSEFRNREVIRTDAPRVRIPGGDITESSYAAFKYPPPRMQMHS